MVRDIQSTVARLGGPGRVSELAGVDRRTVERWLTGERGISEPTWRLLEFIDAEQLARVTT